MKKIKFISIITILLTLVLFVFALPAIDLTMFGINFRADGLNLKTITKGRYEGELKFGDGVDVRGGKKYNFVVDMKDALKDNYSEEELSKLNFQEMAKNSSYKMASRLEKLKLKDFDMTWYIDEDDILHITLITGNKSANVEEAIPLLAGKGEIEFYSQDPNYQEPEDETNQQFDLFAGLRKIDISRDDIKSFKSVYSSKTNKYGFKITFKKESADKLFNYIQLETTRGTMLFIDGQPIAFRSYSVDNLTPIGQKEPVMYMSSIFATSYLIDDAIEAIYATGPLDFDIQFTNTNDISPTLGINFELNFKFAFFTTFFLLTLLLIYKYKRFGVYLFVINFIYLVFNIFILKLFMAQLTLPLILGQLISFVFFLILNIDFYSKIKENKLKNLKDVNEGISQFRKDYKKLLILFLGTIVIFAFTPIMEIAFFSNGIGVGLVISLLLIYLLGSGLFKLFLISFDR